MPLAGVVRQLGHELQHVAQFEQGIWDFARQEFLAYSWMIFGDQSTGSTSLCEHDSFSPVSQALPPLSKEEVLAIAGHVNEFW